jgi:hypothetical protein
LVSQILANSVPFASDTFGLAPNPFRPLDIVQPLHDHVCMPTIHRIGGTTIRVNTPDHRPAHVHVVLADRRDAMVILDTLAVISRTVTAREIAEALVWIEVNRDEARRIFEECNP